MIHPSTEPGEALRALPGIGPAYARRLALQELGSLDDLAWFVPRAYFDLRRVLPLREAVAGDGARVVFAAEVVRVRWSGWRRKRFLEVLLQDGDARVVGRWFNLRGANKLFEPGRRLVLAGVLRERLGQISVANAQVLGAEDDDGTTARAAIQPRYPDLDGVPAAVVRRVCRLAAERARPEDDLPDAVRQRLQLPDLGDCLTALHLPPADLTEAQVAALNRGDSPWHRRLAFGELFSLALAVTRRRALRQRLTAPACAARPAAIATARAVFPFALTGAQARAVAAITADLARDAPMNRLLQGDVGSGKTAVAFVAAAAAVAAGRQVAIMAPTELLAEQHLATLRPWVDALGRRVALLTSSTTRLVREGILGMLAAGRLDILVGTHALLGERVDFRDLGLVVIDEQHRFGVAQRVRLRVGREREALPHLLVMTATPIPRSLALTVYGDLDVTVLDELPPGRLPVATRVLGGARGRQTAYKQLAQIVDEGGRAFVVCPLVAPSDDSPDWSDATSTAARLAEELAPRRVGLAHGRMSAAERDEAMTRLRSGELDVLVATTVIEVGVDVPTARVMVIQDADRFGLAQLHQLRGRVGRSGDPASCFLLTRGTRTSDAARRLAIMEETCDGFRIAEEDLAIRGPGELLGVRQAGLPRLHFADVVKHAVLAAQARREAEHVLAADPDLARPEHAAAARALARRVAQDAVSAEGG